MLETYHDSNLNSDVYELTLDSSKRLWQGIAELSSRDFEGVMVQRSWRTAKNTDFSAYSITPVLPDDPAALRYPARGSRKKFFLRAGVETEYTEYFDGKWTGPEDPVVDQTLGVGLVYDDGSAKRLVAVCSGALLLQGPTITQIQDVSRKTNEFHQYDRAVAMASGLRNGIEWKQTLVKAWSRMLHNTLPLAVPELAGSSVLVGAAHNNYWVRHEGIMYSPPKGWLEPGFDQAQYQLDLIERFKHVYDETAIAMGGVAIKGAEEDRQGDYMLSTSYSLSNAARVLTAK